MLYDAAFCNDELGFILSPRAVFKTENGGLNFHKIENIPQPDEPIVYKKMKILDDDNYYLLVYSPDRDDYIISTTDAGATWTEHNTLPERVNDFEVFNKNHIVGTGGRLNTDCSVIISSYDGGHSWKTSLDTLTFPGSTLFDLDFADSLHGVVMGYYMVLWRTSDGGDTWYEEPENLSDLSGTAFKSMAYPHKDYLYTTSYFTAPIFKWTAKGVGVSEETTGNSRQLAAYPNPLLSGHPLHIYFNSEPGAEYTINLYDFWGRPSGKGFTFQAKDDKTLIDFDSEGLSPGVYTLIVEYGSNSYSAKILIK